MDILNAVGVLFFFSVTGIAIVIMILRFDKKQTLKVKAILRETRDVPPLFLLKSTEQKISTLKAALRYEDALLNIAAVGPATTIYDDQSVHTRQLKVQEFKLFSAKYNNGQISIEEYNVKLDELLLHLERHSGTFGLAC